MLRCAASRSPRASCNQASWSKARASPRCAWRLQQFVGGLGAAERPEHDGGRAHAVLESDQERIRIGDHRRQPRRGDRLRRRHAQCGTLCSSERPQAPVDLAQRFAGAAEREQAQRALALVVAHDRRGRTGVAVRPARRGVRNRRREAVADRRTCQLRVMRRVRRARGKRVCTRDLRDRHARDVAFERDRYARQCAQQRAVQVLLVRVSARTAHRLSLQGRVLLQALPHPRRCRQPGDEHRGVRPRAVDVLLHHPRRGGEVGRGHDQRARRRCVEQCAAERLERR